MGMIFTNTNKEIQLALPAPIDMGFGETFSEIKLGYPALTLAEFTEESLQTPLVMHRWSTQGDWRNWQKIITDLNLLIGGTLDELSNKPPNESLVLHCAAKWKLKLCGDDCQYKTPRPHFCEKDDRTDIFRTLIVLTDLITISFSQAQTQRKKINFHLEKIFALKKAFNKGVTKLHGFDKLYYRIPTLDTTPHKKFRGGVQSVLDKQIDSFVGVDVDHSLKSICSHKTSNKSNPCWYSTVGVLQTYVEQSVGSADNWICGVNIPFKFNGSDLTVTNSLINFIAMKCPMAKMPCCKPGRVKNPHNKIFASFDNSQTQLCTAPIPLRKILGFLPKEFVKKIWALIIPLYIRICQRDSPHVVFYCRNNQCELSAKGFIHNEKSHAFGGRPETHANCLKCLTAHYVHQHRIECPVCKQTFCNACESIPYHELIMCAGPNADPERLAVLTASGSKACPNCSHAVILDGGCDHIKCRCGIDWCFRCSKRLNPLDVYKHVCIPADVLVGSVSPHYR